MRRFPIANVAGKVQRRGAILVGQIDCGSRVHQELHAQRIAVDARVEQRGGAIRVLQVELGVALEEVEHALAVAIVARDE